MDLAQVWRDKKRIRNNNTNLKTDRTLSVCWSPGAFFTALAADSKWLVDFPAFSRQESLCGF
jgi:hypothetical protein